MPRELGLPKYFKFDELEAGTQLVKKGEYVGETTGKFGPNFNFINLFDGEHVVLSGGSLKWRMENGDIVKGDVVDIYFDGQGVMEKGSYKGKKVNNFKIEIYTATEKAEMVADGAELRNALPEISDIVDVKASDSNESLGDLA